MAKANVFGMNAKETTDDQEPEARTIIVPRRPEARVVAVDDLVENPLQPMTRTKETQLQSLRDKMVESKIVTRIAVVPMKRQKGKYIIGDGHRRVAAARELGVVDIAVDVYSDVPAGMLFLWLNFGTKRFAGNTYLTAWAKADDRDLALKHIPHPYRGQIAGLVDVLGEDRTIEIGLNEKDAPSLVNWINKITALLSKYRDEDAPTARKIGEWLLDGNRGRDVQMFLDDPNSNRARRLCYAIKSGTKFKFSGRTPRALKLAD